MKNSQDYNSPCFYFHLRRATRAVGQVYEKYFRPTGLRSGQFAMLATIRQLERLSIGELGTVMGMDQTTTTRNVELLSRKGLVNLQADSGDARRKTLALTPAGRAKLQKAEPRWRQAQAELTANLGLMEAERLMEMLELLVKAVKK